MKNLLASLCLALSITSSFAQKTEIVYLSGTDKDHTVDWNFFCTKGRNSDTWTKIGVPSNWELQGFGTYNYGHDIPLGDEHGLYKHSFQVSADWKGKNILIVFEGSMTDTEVKINGKLAGPIHQGAFYRFTYDITKLLKIGQTNLLEINVSKMSSNYSVNEAERTADYWVFGGIFRPVYLEAYPKEYISRVAIDAKANGSFSLNVYLNGINRSKQIEAQVTNLAGKTIGSPLVVNVNSKQGMVTLNGSFPNPLLWTPEFPNLYQVEVRLKDDSSVKHTMNQKFGFRTVEVKKRDGIYVNGEKIMFRGVCRHSAWPSSGRCLSKELSITDVNLMKDMNMNAVRMSHYPPDQHFLDVCDSLGLFVLDELAGWQYPPYDTIVGRKLVKEMVVRDVNHPSIVLWDNGNEGGFNFGLLNEYAKYDPQNRKVIQPWDNINGMNTHHYISYDYGATECFNGRDIFFPTEFLHGLYDGGHGAGLDDYWNLMLSNPLSAGGFLWVFADEGIVRRDKNDSIDTKKNNAPDGILGPYREKEASFYTIKEIWSPVFFEKKYIIPDFNGKLFVSNRFFYTNLSQCKFSCQFVRLPDNLTKSISDKQDASIKAPALEPGAKGFLTIDLPKNWQDFDVFYITSTDPFGRKINTWSWNISSPETMASRLVKTSSGKVSSRDEGDFLILASGNTEVFFNKTNGLLSKVITGGKNISLNGGPVPAGFDAKFKEIKHYQKGDNHIIEIAFEGKNKYNVTWTMLPGDWLQLNYSYRPGGMYDYLGVSFSYPENLVLGAKLLANGPYRVWKNRMKGMQFGLFDKKYNNTVTGESWDYPEFKGYYSNFYAIRIETKELPITIVSATEDLFLHLFTPEAPKGAFNTNTAPPFPVGNISFLHGISAIGTKFTKAETSGPQSFKNEFSLNGNSESLSGQLYFKFGEGIE